MTDVFTTPHGSRLYGLHHANSDYDTYTVTFNGNGQANHRVIRRNTGWAVSGSASRQANLVLEYHST